MIHGPVPLRGPGIGDPWPEGFSYGLRSSVLTCSWTQYCHQISTAPFWPICPRCVHFCPLNPDTLWVSLSHVSVRWRRLHCQNSQSHSGLSASSSSLLLNERALVKVMADSGNLLRHLTLLLVFHGSLPLLWLFNRPLDFHTVSW